jgi:hypothetical protein
LFVQLAVLATYCEADCVAAYHHCRSILSAAPFSGGFENLSALLAKNAAAARAQGLLAPAGPAEDAARGPSRRRGGAAQLPVFLTRFLHLHGVLFGCSTRMHRSYAQLRGSQPGFSAPSQQSQQSWPPLLSPAVESALCASVAVDSAGPLSSEQDSMEERFAALLQAVLEGFDEQLTAGSVPDVLLVRLLSIALFSVHYAAGREANLLGWHDTVCTEEGLRRYQLEQSGHARTTVEALALTALFGLVNRFATICRSNRHLVRSNNAHCCVVQNRHPCGVHAGLEGARGTSSAVHGPAHAVGVLHVGRLAPGPARPFAAWAGQREAPATAT